MAETRVLIVTPLKADISKHYSKTLIELLTGTIPGYFFGHVFMSGNCVMGARDWGANQMERENWDGILWWDADLAPGTADIVRLLSHKQDFVCGAYCGRDVSTHWHFFPVSPEAEILESGLWQMQKAAIGFSFIRRSVFDKIRAAHPEYTYANQEQGTGKTQLQQYFPWQIIGPNSVLGKFERIKDFLKGQLERPHNATEMLREISRIVDDTDYSQNLMQGEDYGFCRLAREAGVEIWLDTRLVVPHLGECEFPIAHEDVVKMTLEPWRQDFWAKLREDHAAKGAA